MSYIQYETLHLTFGEQLAMVSGPRAIKQRWLGLEREGERHPSGKIRSSEALSNANIPILDAILPRTVLKKS